MRLNHLPLSEWLPWSLLLLACTIVIDSAYVVGQEMRIETYIYGEDEAADPLSHTVTLFDKNTVYDFVDNPQQIAIFRAPTPGSGGQFILLDVASAHKGSQGLGGGRNAVRPGSTRNPGRRSSPPGHGRVSVFPAARPPPPAAREGVSWASGQRLGEATEGEVVAPTTPVAADRSPREGGASTSVGCGRPYDALRRARA